jgi:hypothetical protein
MLQFIELMVFMDFMITNLIVIYFSQIWYFHSSDYKDVFSWIMMPCSLVDWGHVSNYAASHPKRKQVL